MEEANSVITPTLDKGSLILVTGASGYIASHCIDQFLLAGYRVRGTVRSLDKADWLYELFDKKYGKGKFEAAIVPDMSTDNAFDESVKGVNGICHAASVMTFSDNPDEVIPVVVKGALNVLTAATTEPSVKSFVYTSSSCALLMAQPNKVIKVTKDTWDDEAVSQAATAPTPYNVYAASKTEAERAIWEAVRNTNPPFQVSAVLPNMNLGEIINPAGAAASSTAKQIYNLFHGERSTSSPQWFVDVQDTARLHVIAMIDRNCAGERLFAFAEPFNESSLLDILRRQNPEREFLPNREEEGRDLSEIPTETEVALLQKHYGKGFTSLEESVKRTTVGMA